MIQMTTPDNLGNIDYDSTSPYQDMNANISIIKSFFELDDTFKLRKAGMNNQFSVLFVDGMVNADTINRFIISPLNPISDNELPDQKLPVCETTVTEKFSEAVAALLSGDTVVVTEGCQRLLLLGSKGFVMRSVNEPDNEKTLFGPRDGFTESLMQNTSMLRRKLQTTDLKFEFFVLGSRTQTRVCISYLSSLVNSKVLETIKKRIEELCIDGVLDTNTIAEQIKDLPDSLFSTTGKTERPDTAADKLLDGGVTVMLDGTPVALLAPYLFVEHFQSRDDYYLGYYYASISRLLRYLAFFISVSTGALYIALISFHSEMLPTSFLLTISSATSGIPIPTVMEFILMMILFEMLRETGIRMSSKIGQSLSIVGALVIGQAAVEARIVSAPMVIVVAVSAISGLMIPGISSATIITRVAAVLAASVYGFYGYGFVMLALCILLCSMESFGIQYTAKMLSFNRHDFSDSFIRAPSNALKLRTKFLARERLKQK